MVVGSWPYIFLFGAECGSSVVPIAGASVLRPRRVVELLIHLATLLGPIHLLLLATALLQLPVLVVGMAPLLVDSGTSFTASL